jgi:hypothetical protein
VPEGASGNTQRLGAAKLPPQLSQRRAVERPPFREGRAHDDVGRQHAPGRAVELHGDTTARCISQRGDGRQSSYFVFAAAFSTASGGASTFPFCGSPSTAGSSRALATCSGPSSSWIFARMP